MSIMYLIDNTQNIFSYSVDPIDEEEEREAGNDSDLELLDDMDIEDTVHLVWGSSEFVHIL